MKNKKEANSVPRPRMGVTHAEMVDHIARSAVRAHKAWGAVIRAVLTAPPAVRAGLVREIRGRYPELTWLADGIAATE